MSADNTATPETVERAVDDAGGLPGPEELAQRHRLTFRASEELIDALEDAVEAGHAPTRSAALRQAAHEWLQGGAE